ncbi:hypothetical protein AKJ63_01845 [candidate division MSBL1 archaeon SCGC-AAA259D18]|uniref:Lysine transporter LysE n=1 Tax=candidate division MSBL1 archaeon SCGC-AAA259D18 TaxID=1698262 RepID=A0A133UAF3_9EURY|nr:hypothetical protein AKJ63_01845 [candidate division MSBL1 archaeon SCGC-AAA259D18]
MLELLFQLSVGFSIALSGVLIPGPLLAFISIKTLDSGPKTGTLAATGHIIVELGILSLVTFGLGSLLKNEIFTQAIGTFGGLLLLGLGPIIILKSRDTPKSTQDIAGKKLSPLIGGILFSTIFNPSVTLWWMTVGLATLMGAINESGVIGGIFWIIGHFSADMGWFSAVSFSVNRGKKIIGGAFYKGLLIACGFTLLIFGIIFTANYLPNLLF